MQHHALVMQQARACRGLLGKNGLAIQGNTDLGIRDKFADPGHLITVVIEKSDGGKAVR